MSYARTLTPLAFSLNGKLKEIREFPAGTVVSTDGLGPLEPGEVANIVLLGDVIVFGDDVWTRILTNAADLREISALEALAACAE